MAIKGAKTIAEYAIRKWLEQEGFMMDCFILTMDGPQEAILKDSNGDKLRLVYNPISRMVFPMDMPGGD